MSLSFIKKYIRFVIPPALGLAALGIPLLRDFHMESALLVSLAGCFWAGWKASGPQAPGNRDSQTAMHILGYLYLFGVPLLFYSLLMGCFSVHGLGFWLLYPIPSVFFGYAVGRLTRIWNIPYGRMLTLFILLGIAVGGFLVEFFSFPQVYFFNHVWGGWPGPIYDETVQLSGSLFVFRFLTLGWILLLWFIPQYGKDRQAQWIFWLSAVVLALGYFNLAEMGLVSPESHLRQQLGGSYETPHFSIYYDRGHFSENEIRLLAHEHEFYLDEISRHLELNKPGEGQKIQSFLYAHPWQKKQLVGAKFTSYVPVWLKQDQLHIAKGQIRSSLRHELVHVLSKQFGNRLFNASWSIGLVEGLAVALAPNESSGSTIDQIVASKKPYPGAYEMQQALLPLGFYGGRSPVNYTTSGSFVKYLLRKYPPRTFKQAYQTGDVELAYGIPFSTLVEGWHSHLKTVTVDSADQRVAQRLFSIPSLFEQTCPRNLTSFAQSWDKYEKYLADGDTSKALVNLEAALNHAPKNKAVKTAWTFRNLKAGNVERVQFMATTEDSSAELQMLYADAFALAGEQRVAGRHLNAAMVQLSRHPGEPLERALATRIDPVQWRHYLQLTYRDSTIGPEVFPSLYYRTKIRALEQVIRKENAGLLVSYAAQLLTLPADRAYFDRYIHMIHWLGYLGEVELAEAWIEKLRTLSLRERHQERLEQERRWVQYAKKSIGISAEQR